MDIPTSRTRITLDEQPCEEVITMASDDEELAFAEEIDPELAQILAEISQYCDTMPQEDALDLIDKCRMTSVCRDLARLDGGGGADH